LIPLTAPLFFPSSVELLLLTSAAKGHIGFADCEGNSPLQKNNKENITVVACMMQI
jgi:hypothetical protein